MYKWDEQTQINKRTNFIHTVHFRFLFTEILHNTVIASHG